MRWRRLVVAAAGVVAAAVLLYVLRSPRPDRTVETALSAVVNDYRKIIVLMDGVDDLDAAVRTRCTAVGEALFWREHRGLEEISRLLAADPKRRTARLQQFTHYLTDNTALHDADKLAFLGLVGDLSDPAPMVRPRCVPCSITCNPSN